MRIELNSDPWLREAPRSAHQEGQEEDQVGAEARVVKSEAAWEVRAPVEVRDEHP